jgi:hypothetical protein
MQRSGRQPAVQVAGTGVDIGVDVARRADGTFTCTGQLGGNATFAPGSPSEAALPGAGGYDGFLATWTF